LSLRALARIRSSGTRSISRCPSSTCCVSNRFRRALRGVGEYGSVSNPAERTFLASISPYHNVKAGVSYPEPLIWTTTKDDRVGLQHARKFAAKLASLGIPYLFYEVTEGGHASGANIKERSFTNALEFTYFTRKLTGLP
jgi:prolyl oligopeptidase